MHKRDITKTEREGRAVLEWCRGGCGQCDGGCSSGPACQGGEGGGAYGVREVCALRHKLSQFTLCLRDPGVKRVRLGPIEARELVVKALKDVVPLPYLVVGTQATVGGSLFGLLFQWLGVTRASNYAILRFLYVLH